MSGEIEIPVCSKCLRTIDEQEGSEYCLDCRQSMAQYHFVVMWDNDTQQWSLDMELTDWKLDDGAIYSTADSEWIDTANPDWQQSYMDTAALLEYALRNINLKWADKEEDK